MNILNTIFDFLIYHTNVYVAILGRLWRDITPSQYGILLIMIAFGGYLMMRGAARK